MASKLVAVLSRGIWDNESTTPKYDRGIRRLLPFLILKSDFLYYHNIPVHLTPAAASERGKQGDTRGCLVHSVSDNSSPAQS